MGLLDEAIREHLELKRRRGADPGTVAREEKAALGPERAAADDSDARPASDAQAADAEHDGAHITQETAELDMRTVLDPDD